MMILYCCLFYIFVIILSTSDPTSITFTLYYYLREQKTPQNRSMLPSLPEMQTDANESMTTKFMQKNHTDAKNPCLPAGGIEGREKGQ